MNGFAVTIYNKFDELAILVDILRRNWQQDMFISVASNHPDAASAVGKLDVDIFTPAEDIHYPPELAKKPGSLFGRRDRENAAWRHRGRINKVCRNYANIKASNEGLLGKGLSWGTHVHGDAWPLDEEKYNRLLHEMQSRGRPFAYRGFGFGVAMPSAPVGNLDDHFFTYAPDFLQRIGFFERDGMELLPHKLSIHGLLAVLVLVKVGLNNAYFFDDLSANEVWPGRTARYFWRPVNPASFNARTAFLHVHASDFPEPLGKNLQALYLHKFGLEKGKAIPAFLQQYYVPEAELVGQLNERLAAAQRRLRRFFSHVEIFGDVIRQLEEAYRRQSKWRLLCSDVMFKAWLLERRWLYGKRTSARAVQHDDSLWPEDIYAIYRERVDKTHFLSRQFWFDEEGRA